MAQPTDDTQQEREDVTNSLRRLTYMLVESRDKMLHAEADLMLAL